MDGVNLMGFTTNTSRRQPQGLGARGVSRALGTLAVLAGLSTIGAGVAEAEGEGERAKGAADRSAGGR